MNPLAINEHNQSITDQNIGTPLSTTNRHHNRVHRENRTTANSIATINSVATGDIQSAMSAATSEAGDIYDSNNTQVCDLRYFRKAPYADKCNEQNLIFLPKPNTPKIEKQFEF